MGREAKYVVKLSAEERARLQGMVDRGERAKTVRARAAILLRADEAEGGLAWPDAKIAEALQVGLRTVERTRRQLVEEGLEATLVRVPSPNRQYRKLDGAQEAQLVRLACSPPPPGRAKWTMALLADRLVELKVIASIGVETVRTTLKKTCSSPGSSSSGSCRRPRTASSSRPWRTCSKSASARTTRNARASASTSKAGN